MTILGLGSLTVVMVLASYAYVVEKIVTEQSHERSVIVLQLLDRLALRSLLQHEYVDLQSFLEQFQSDNSIRNVFVFNVKGTVVASLRREWIGKKLLDVPKDYPDVLTYTKDINTVYSKLGRLHVMFNRSATVSSLSSARNYAILAGFAAVILMAFFAGLVSKVFSMRLEKLSRSVRDFGAGEHQLRSGVSGPDEIGVLANHFNMMADSVVSMLGELEEYQESLRETLDQTTEIIQVVDRKGTIQFVNSAWQETLGYKYTNVVGTNILNMLHPDDRNHFTESMAKVAVDGKRQDVRFRMLKASDGIVFLKGRLTASMSEGNVESIATYLVDVTKEHQFKQEQAELRVQLSHLQKAELMGTMAGGIAHDFNNILAPVLGYTQLAIADAEDPQAVREYLHQVEMAVERLRAMVNQLLNLNRKRESLTRVIQFQNIIMEATDLVRASISNDVALDIQCTKEPVYVEVNPTEMHQVILNLCTNAAKAIVGSYGSIIVRLTLVNKDSLVSDIKLPQNDHDADFVCLEVEDNGLGMDSEVLQRVFEPFFTTRARDEGTGLGLAVVHSIISRYGGSIYAKSTEGIGSTFYVYLPIVEKPEQKKEIKKIQVVEGSGRILLVDDEEKVASVICKMLERSGYNVTIRSDGLNGLQELENGDEYDLVLSDLSMPNLNGKDFAKIAFEVKPEVPFIIMTGFRDAEKLSQLEDVNIAQVLEKPVKLHELQNIVAHVIKNRTENNKSP